MSFWFFQSILLLLATLKVNIVSDGLLSISIVILAIGLFPIFVREFRISGQLFLAYWFVITLHQCVAFANNFLFLTPGGNADSDRFHTIGVKLAKNLGLSLKPLGNLFIPSMDGKLGEVEIWTSFIGIIYWLIHPSRLLGSQISIMAFGISCIILIKILVLLEFSRYKVSALLAFGSLPSMVLLGSIPLRESCQILFFMLAIYFGLKMHLKGSVKGHFLLMVASAYLMGVLHHGLMKYAVILIVLFLVWTPHVSSSLLAIKKQYLISVIALLTLLGIVFFVVKLRNFNECLLCFQGGLKHAILLFRENSGTVVTRSSYSVGVVDFSSVFATTKTFFILYAQYLFAPFPWQLKSALDFFAFLESLVRMVFIYFSVKHWLSSNGQKRRVLGFMLILFISVSYMFALATTNYGTAIRHNMLSWWILVVIGTPLLIERLLNFFKYFSIRRSYIL